VAQAVEPSKHEDLSSNPSTAKKEKREEKILKRCLYALHTHKNVKKKKKDSIGEQR
jgi:hypothetical protein